jgi:CRISPR-associated endonuclease/helicase Cas3
VRVFCYHSRYRLCDRKQRHDEVIDAFRIGAEGAALAVTTQVCEMGLDLDADLLVTETAPITALIQRMGRCNRAREPRDQAGHVFVYDPENRHPYGPEELLGTEEFLENLAIRKTVRQVDLEAALQAAPSRKETPRAACQFLTSGPFASAGMEMFREIEEFTQPAVLDSDLATILARLAAKQPIDGYVVPVPRKLRSDAPAGLPKYLGVARSRHYLITLGFSHEPLATGDPPPCPESKPPLIV